MTLIGFSKTESILSWTCRVASAVILVQTLYFKFSGAEESIYIFTKVGLEPWGRIGSGVAELIAAVLLFVPGLVWLGAGLAMGLMCGAILSHFTILGIVVENDGGLLFALAWIVFLCSAVLLYLYRRKIPVIGERLA
jgi:uncharacterized membrane protein YphA (DoxX/SURF4 family)